MKSAKTWCLAGFVLVAGLSSASCGKDEGTTGGGGGHGTVIGGSGGAATGTAGTRTAGGTNGRGGTDAAGGATDAPTAATKLGRACVSAKDCVDPAAPGLTCVTAKDTLLGDGAPPKGLCTATCTMPGDMEPDPCAALGSNGICVPFEANTDQGYCLEGCTFGDPDIGEAKCHNRSEFNCNAALFGDTKEPCTTDDDCPSPDFCGGTGTCIIYATACMPQCRGDLDCDVGMYCDQSYFGGTCLEEKPVGKELGARCTVPAPNEPDEPDDCLGWCRPDASGSSKGHCAANCSIGRQCSWNAETQKFDGICLYASFLTVESGALGDVGSCTPTCNCSSECDKANVGCELLSGQALSSDFRAPGLCFTPDASSVVYDQCGAGGAGVGGADAGGAANGGDGSGGVPAGGAGG
jgi:hypothetical protein